MDGFFWIFFFFREFLKVFASPLFCTPSMKDERAVFALHQLSDAADPAAFYRTRLPPSLYRPPPCIAAVSILLANQRLLQ